MPRILVIDPDLEVLGILKVILREEGFDVVTVTDLLDVDDLLRRDRFDLILTEMFDQEDYLTFDPAFLESLQNESQSVPIILLSIYPSVDQVKAGRLGLSAVVSKPFDIDNLLAKIKEVLS